MEDKLSLSKKKQIFETELKTLVDKEYIQETEYTRIQSAYDSYYVSEVKNIKEVNLKQIIDNKKIIKEESPKAKIVTKPKVQLSVEQIRERNITWSLVLGVILLLISGLVVATSNWGNMSNLMKISSIGLVSAVFYGISVFSDKVLKINKTSFAFLTLSSLFLPIIIFSIGYFQLFGSYFSLNNHGGFVLGLIGGATCTLLYAKIVQKYKHRLFLWLTYLSSSITIAFLLKAIYLPIDAFFLGIMLYNALLMYIFHKFKNKYELFTKELPSYAQLNLILSTLLMLFLFENIVFYSFNIIITAALYISMIYVYEKKNYHFVFSALIVYGIYQLIENTPLIYMEYILFAAVGFVFIGFQYYYKNEEHLKKMFQYTSAIISFCTFVFITVKGVALRFDNPSILILFAYLTIALNYLYLSNITKKLLFKYLSPIFIVIAGVQSWTLLSKHFTLGIAEIYMFLFGTLMFAVFYLYNQHKHTTAIKESSFYVSHFVMLLSALTSFGQTKWLDFSFIMFVYGFVFYATSKHAKENIIKQMSTIVTPMSWYLSLAFTYHYMAEKSNWYAENLNISFHLCVSALILLLVSYIFKKLNDGKTQFVSFSVSQVGYTIGLISLFVCFTNETIRPLLLLVGICMYILLVKVTQQRHYYTLVSISALLFTLSFYVFIPKGNEQFLILYMIFVPLLLLLVYQYVGRKYVDIKPYFFWTAHIYLPFATLIAAIVSLFNHVDSYGLLVSLAMYIYSTLISKKEWMIKLFLYSSFSTFILWLAINLPKLNMKYIELDYILLISTIFIVSLWLVLNETWKKRIDWYLIPLSISSTLVLVSFYGAITNLVLTIINVIITLFLLHKRKWNFVIPIPLFLLLFKWVDFSNYMRNDSLLMAVLTVIIFLINKEFGQRVYQNLCTKAKRFVIIDWYSIFALFYIGLMYSYINFESPIWLQLIPPLLMIYFLYSQIKRTGSEIGEKIVKTITIIVTLYPYYVFLSNIDISKYIVTELYVLPWIVLTIILSKKTWSDAKDVMRNIQLSILLIVASILVVDGQNSHTIYDAVILGSLSLMSIVGGMHYRIKSFFLVGSGVLLLNVFVQTRPYWGNTPWWVYLLFAGLVLIGFASFYEWQKQKKDNDGNTLIQAKKKEFIEKFKKWN